METGTDLKGFSCWGGAQGSLRTRAICRCEQEAQQYQTVESPELWPGVPALCPGPCASIGVFSRV